MEKTAILTKKYRKETKRKEWVLLSKTTKRPLKWFGPKKPTEDEVKKEEKRVHSFGSDKNVLVKEIIKISDKLDSIGLIHLSDILTSCAKSIIFGKTGYKTVINLGKIVNILYKKGEYNLADDLDSIIPQTLCIKNSNCNIKIEKPRITAKRAYNIYKLFNKKYLEGMIDKESFEYEKMKELKSLLKSGFIFPIPNSYKEFPKDVNNWWDHFEGIKNGKI